jgi:hypothetical protein
VHFPTLNNTPLRAKTLEHRIMEILIDIAVLIRPFYRILAVVYAWKIFTEFLYPMSETPIFE